MVGPTNRSPSAISTAAFRGIISSSDSRDSTTVAGRPQKPSRLPGSRCRPLDSTHNSNTFPGCRKLSCARARRARDKEMRMLGLLIGVVALGGGFVGARSFVRRRLRYVDAVQKPAAPLVAGLAATAVALPGAARPGGTGITGVAF